MSHESRRRALETTGLIHPRPHAVTAPLFGGDHPFFFALDKVQVKYEMLRAHLIEGDTVTVSAADTATPEQSSTWWRPPSKKRA